MKPWKIGAALFIALLVLVLLHLMGIVSYPSTETLARKYTDAIIDGDVERAVELASPGCRRLVEEDAQQDIQQYGGAEVRDIRVEVVDGTGSDEEYQIAFVTFEYRPESQTTWQAGKISLSTDYEPIGFRQLSCGG